MEKLKSLQTLGIKFGKRLEDNFYIDLGILSLCISINSPKILAWGEYTGFIIMCEEKKILINHNAKFGDPEKALIPILENNTDKGIYVLLEGPQLPYFFIRNNSGFIKWCIKFTNSFELMIKPLNKTNPFYNYRHNGHIKDANFIVIDHDAQSHFVLLTN